MAYVTTMINKIRRLEVIDMWRQILLTIVNVHPRSWLSEIFQVFVDLKAQRLRA